VTVQAQGAPLSLSVEGPLPNPSPPMVQSGAGTLRINYTVTPQDLQRGMFWQFHVGLAQPSPPQSGARANGSVTVQHPPVDQAKVTQAMAVLIVNRHQPAPAARAEAVAQAQSQREADFKAHVAQIAQRRAQNHAAVFAQRHHLVRTRSRVVPLPLCCNSSACRRRRRISRDSQSPTSRIRSIYPRVRRSTGNPEMR